IIEDLMPVHGHIHGLCCWLRSVCVEHNLPNVHRRTWAERWWSAVMSLLKLAYFESFGELQVGYISGEDSEDFCAASLGDSAVSEEQLTKWEGLRSQEFLRRRQEANQQRRRANAIRPGSRRQLQLPSQSAAGTTDDTPHRRSLRPRQRGSRRPAPSSTSTYTQNRPPRPPQQAAPGRAPSPAQAQAAAAGCPASGAEPEAAQATGSRSNSLHLSEIDVASARASSRFSLLLTTELTWAIGPDACELAGVAARRAQPHGPPETREVAVDFNSIPDSGSRLQPPLSAGLARLPADLTMAWPLPPADAGYRGRRWTAQSEDRCLCGDQNHRTGGAASPDWKRDDSTIWWKKGSQK
uniref:RUN domain-containing protein n=1 Tax=Macrostomum lignano TaxID=282301 RepID=A0A1I8FHJ5_9PLAT